MVSRWVVTTPLGHRVGLSEDGWKHKILVSHPEFATNPNYELELRLALQGPEFIVEGWSGELLNLRWCPTAPGKPKYVCAVYREVKPLGFVITAFFISRHAKLLRRTVLWQKSP